MYKNQTVVIVDKTFRKLIQFQNYEEYVYKIINRSTVIFKDISFTRIPSQSHGESDFIDNNNQAYDAKLLFNNKQGELIGNSKNKFELWLNAMLDEKAEFAESIRKRDTSFIAKTKLYNIMQERLATVQEYEYPIFFIPFPIVDEYKGSLFMQSLTDFLQAVYIKLEENQLIGNRRVFFIYPDGYEHEYVLRDDCKNREYIQCEELDDFVCYRTTMSIY